MRNLIWMIIPLLMSAAYADDEVETPHRSTVYFYAGPTLGNALTQNTSSSGTAIASGKTNDSGSLRLGLEYNYNITNSWFSLSGMFEWNKYNYAVGGPSDTLLSFLVMPKAQVHTGSFVLWGGLAGGLISTSFGQSTISSGSTTLTMDGSNGSFGLSPRIGMDYVLSNNKTLGIQLDYTTTSGSINGTLSNASSTVSLKDDYVRSYWTLSAKFGLGL